MRLSGVSYRMVIVAKLRRRGPSSPPRRHILNVLLLARD